MNTLPNPDCGENASLAQFDDSELNLPNECCDHVALDIGRAELETWVAEFGARIGGIQP